MPVAGSDHGEDAARCLGQIDRLDPRRDSAGDQPLDRSIVEGAEHARQEFTQGRRDLPAMRGLGQPDSGMTGRIELRQLGQDVLGREEILLDELAELTADPVLVARNDRSMWNRQAERMPEQRHDSEPVGNRADHRCLGKGLDPDQPGIGRFQRHRSDEQHRHGQQQRRRQHPHPPQPAALAADAVVG